MRSRAVPVNTCVLGLSSRPPVRIGGPGGKKGQHMRSRAVPVNTCALGSSSRPPVRIGVPVLPGARWLCCSAPGLGPALRCPGGSLRSPPAGIGSLQPAPDTPFTLILPGSCTTFYHFLLLFCHIFRECPVLSVCLYLEQSERVRARSEATSE